MDAAWGGALLLSEKYRHFLNGLELADSVTLDFHKQFFQTISCGAFLLKDARHYQLMRYQAAYLNSDFDEEQGVPNLVSKSLQTTRRFDALKLWMGLEALGKKQYAEIIDNGVTLAQQVAQFVVDQPQLELVMQPQLASVPFPSGKRRHRRRCVAEPAYRRCVAGLRGSERGRNGSRRRHLPEADPAQPCRVSGRRKSSAGKRDGLRAAVAQRLIATDVKKADRSDAVGFFFTLSFP